MRKAKKSLKRIKGIVFSLCLLACLTGVAYPVHAGGVSADSTVSYICQTDDGTGNLTSVDKGKPTPIKTGDKLHMGDYLVTVITALGIIIVLLIIKKKREEEER